MAPSTKRSDPPAEAQSAAELVQWLTSPADIEDAKSVPAPAIPEVPAVPANQESLPPAYRDVLRATRWWLLYGCGAFAVGCILIGAVEALFGR